MSETTLDYEEMRRVTRHALATGLIIPADPIPPKRKRGKITSPRTRPPFKRGLKGHRECPLCHRLVRTLADKMLIHRENVNARGYGTGPICHYDEVTSKLVM